MADKKNLRSLQRLKKINNKKLYKNIKGRYFCRAFLIIQNIFVELFLIIQNIFVELLKLFR